MIKYIKRKIESIRELHRQLGYNFAAGALLRDRQHAVDRLNAIIYFNYLYPSKPSLFEEGMMQALSDYEKLLADVFDNKPAET